MEEADGAAEGRKAPVRIPGTHPTRLCHERHRPHPSRHAADGAGLLPMLFALLASGQQRRQLLAAKHALADKGALRQAIRQTEIRGRQQPNRPRRPVRHLSQRLRPPERGARSAPYAGDRGAEAEWKALSVERKRLWDEWRAEFGETPRRQRTDQGSSSGSGDSRAPSAPRPKDHFSDPAEQRPCPSNPKTCGTGQNSSASTRQFAGQGGIHAGGEPGYSAIESRLEKAPQRGGTTGGRKLQAQAAQGSVALVPRHRGLDRLPEHSSWRPGRQPPGFRQKNGLLRKDRCRW